MGEEVKDLDYAIVRRLDLDGKVVHGLYQCSDTRSPILLDYYKRNGVFPHR